MRNAATSYLLFRGDLLAPLLQLRKQWTPRVLDHRLVDVCIRIKPPTSAPPTTFAPAAAVTSSSAATAAALPPAARQLGWAVSVMRPCGMWASPKTLWQTKKGRRQEALLRSSPRREARWQQKLRRVRRPHPSRWRRVRRERQLHGAISEGLPRLQPLVRWQRREVALRRSGRPGHCSRPGCPGCWVALEGRHRITALEGKWAQRPGATGHAPRGRGARG